MGLHSKSLRAKEEWEELQNEMAQLSTPKP
ncbi:hypothetical protein LINPERHAP1_LOCUS11662 [Linum perenne]